MKIYWHDGGHITKMAALPIYGKKPSKIFTPELVDWFPRNLVCCIGDSCPSYLFKWWSWVDLDLFYGKVKFGNIGLIYSKKWKPVDFSELLQPVTWNCIKLWRYVSIEGQGHFLTLAPGHLHLKLNWLFSEMIGPFWTKFYFVLGPNIRWAFLRTIGPLV